MHGVSPSHDPPSVLLYINRFVPQQSNFVAPLRILVSDDRVYPIEEASQTLFVPLF